MGQLSFAELEDGMRMLSKLPRAVQMRFHSGCLSGKKSIQGLSAPDFHDWYLTENLEQTTSWLAAQLGTIVRVHSLQSVQKHNGALGEIIKFEEKLRWGVKTVTGHVLSLRPSNLTFVSRAAVTEKQAVFYSQAVVPL